MVDEIPSEPSPEAKALRLKEISVEKYTAGNLKAGIKYAKRAERLCPSQDGISEMITAFKVIRSAAQPVFSTSSSDDASRNPSPPDYYEILQVERFSHINTIKKQYKKLALVLHPDKNTFVASEEAFKHVGEAFRVLSDKIRRKEYDMKVRIAMQDEVAAGLDETGDVATFWTLCSTCRLLHKFDRKYLGHNLMCPSCRKSFKAVEVEDNKATEEVTAEEQETVETRVSERIRARKSANDASGKAKEPGNARSKGKRAKVGDDEEMITLAELRKLTKKKKKGGAEKMKSLGKEKGVMKDEMLHEMKKVKALEIEDGEEDEFLVEMEKEHENDIINGGTVKEKEKRESSEGTEIVYRRRASKSKRISEIGKKKISRQCDLEVPVVVEETRFYDFDKDRQDRSFKKGQIWATYENNERMPRNYALIEEIMSTNPFELRLSWLDYLSNGHDQYVNWEKKEGFCIPCGKFKVSDKVSVKSLKMFSHMADSERIARELYWIYPKKGSVWAIYNKNSLDSEERCSSYSIVVLLTTYSDNYGMSVAYLVKVDGFTTVFKRKEVGAGAPLWLPQDDFRLFSHRIPARKLTSEEVATGGVVVSGDCWELDHSAIPSD